jgi:hypothetical protein
MRATIDILAIALAALAIVACFDSGQKIRRGVGRWLMIAKAAVAGWFLLCQSSWVMSRLAGLTYSPIFTEYSWDVFNISVMILFLVSAWTKNLK